MGSDVQEGLQAVFNEYFIFYRSLEIETYFQRRCLTSVRFFSCLFVTFLALIEFQFQAKAISMLLDVEIYIVIRVDKLVSVPDFTLVNG